MRKVSLYRSRHHSRRRQHSEVCRLPRVRLCRFLSARGSHATQTADSVLHCCHSQPRLARALSRYAGARCAHTVAEAFCKRQRDERQSAEPAKPHHPGSDGRHGSCGLHGEQLRQLRDQRPGAINSTKRIATRRNSKSGSAASIRPADSGIYGPSIHAEWRLAGERLNAVEGIDRRVAIGKHIEHVRRAGCKPVLPHSIRRLEVREPLRRVLLVVRRIQREAAKGAVA
jgi:hypothetical protein